MRVRIYADIGVDLTAQRKPIKDYINDEVRHRTKRVQLSANEAKQVQVIHRRGKRMCCKRQLCQAVRRCVDKYSK